MSESVNYISADETPSGPLTEEEIWGKGELMPDGYSQRSTAIVRACPPLTVIAKPHPLSTQKVSATVPHGLTLLEIVGPEAGPCRIEVGGQLIPQPWWRYVRPKPGAVVYVTRFPQGGGGGGWKMIFRLVAFAALAVLTYGIATGVAWLPEAVQALSQGAAAAAAAVVGIGGSLLINALIPPAATGVGQQTSPAALQGISGVQNVMDPYGAITCVFGTTLLTPKLAARSYSELSGNDQYVRALFDLGWGQLTTASLKIGTDDLSNFSGVEYEIGPSPDLFSQDVLETAASAELDNDGNSARHSTGPNADEGGIDLIFGAGLFGVDNTGADVAVTCKVLIEFQSIDVVTSPGSGVWAIPVQDTGQYSAPISATIDITGDGAGATAIVICGIVGASGPNAYYYGVQQIIITNPGTGYSAAAAVLSVFGGSEIRAAALRPVQLGAPNAAYVSAMTADGLTISNSGASSDGTYLVCTSSARQAFRVGVQWKFPLRGQYLVRVTRFVTDWGTATANNRSGSLGWTVLRTVRYALASSTPTTKAALRIKATDQLNGAVSNFNLIVGQIIPAWDGAAWTPIQTSNCAWVLRWLLRDCPANPRLVDPARIDDAAIIDWAAECDAKGLTFDYVNDSVTTVFELVKIICACGRASFTVVDGKFSVVRDVEQTVPVQIFTPRNTSGFSGVRTFGDEVHGLRVQYINPQAGYQQDELLVYDDGYDDSNATKFEQLQIPGCQTAPMAWRLGRYHLAVARLRPNTYAWETDVEHLICNRGDLVLYASDVISAGLGWGRVKGIVLDGVGNVTDITVDEPQNVTDVAPTYAMRFRCQDGSAKTSVVTFDAGVSVSAFKLTVPIAPINPGSGPGTPDFVAGINSGDLFLFGVQGKDSIPMLVSKIEPTADLAAKISAVDVAPEVLNADAGYIDAAGDYHAGMPPLVSSITGAEWDSNSPDPVFTPVPTFVAGMTSAPQLTGSF